MNHAYQYTDLLPAVPVDEQDLALIAAIQRGLPISKTPYSDVAGILGLTEVEVIARLKKLQSLRYIKRFGIVVHHRELGYRANAMTVWDIPDAQVGELGLCMGQFDFVTLCYRRPRHLPEWPYNLFTMIHGQNRSAVQENIQRLIHECGLHDINHEILFSTRRFKQRGAIYRQEQAS